MVTMEDTQGREYEINPDGVEALEALGWKRLDADDAAHAETDEATASDADDAALAAPRRGRPRKK